MRKRIWELSEMQCSVIGTCLSLKELRRILKQADVKIDPGANDFQVHSTAASLCRRDCPCARAVDKALNRKYIGSVQRFAKAGNDAELRALWSQAKDAGAIPGAYWAVLRHPQASERLRAEVYGDVHMLSHMLGASNQADIRELHRVTRDVERLQRKHASLRTRSSARIRELTRSRKALQQTVQRLAKEAETLRQRNKSLAGKDLQAENSALQRSLGMQTLRLVEFKSQMRHTEQLSQAKDRRLATLERELAAKAEEVAFLEAELAHQHGMNDCDGQCFQCANGCEQAGTDQCPGPLLCGKRILYVGGRANLIRHYRELVERLGGVFRHHDGGLEESPRLLTKLVDGMDAVLCPLDCVSHDACRRIKEACRTGTPRFRALKSSGLSSLSRCLEHLATRQEHTDQQDQQGRVA